MLPFKKLNVGDIVLKSPGMQIKEKIVKKYGSIEKFSSELNLYSDSVKQYLYSKSLGSSSFKVKLTLALNSDFHDLYDSEEEQIKKYVKNLTENIHRYNKKSDVELIEKLKKICFEREMLFEYISVCRVYGRYYYNMNKIDRAIAYMDLVIDYLKKKDGQPRLILTMSELGLILCSKGDNERLMSLIKYIYKRLEKSNEDYIYEMHRIYYNLGIIESYLDRRENVIKAFQNCLELSENDLDRAKANIAIGDYYQRQKEYIEAKRYYYLAEELINDKEAFQEENLLYISLAQLFYKLKEYKESEKHIDKIFHRIKGDITSEKNDYLIMYTRIKNKLLKSEEILDMIKCIIEEEKKGYIYYLHHIDLIEEVIEYMKGNKKFLVNLQNILVDAVKNGLINDKEVLNRFKRNIGDVVTKL